MTLRWGERRKVTTGAFPGIVPTPDRRYVFYRGGAGGARGGFGGGRGGAAAGREVWRMTLANQRKERVNFNFPVKIDVRGEWEQIFHESWRSMQYRFYDDLAGWWPLISPPAEYEEEATYAASVLRSSSSTEEHVWFALVISRWRSATLAGSLESRR